MTQLYPHLSSAWEKGRVFLGTDYAVMAGAMSWVSERHLVAAVSNAGAFGVIACSAMPPDLLREEIKATFALTDKPFGVNLIVMHPEMDALIEVCVEEKVSHVVLAGGLPQNKHLSRLKECGVKSVAFAPSAAVAKRLLRAGADALVIEGSEAGGHVGPVSTSVLAQEILPETADKAPVFVAGGIGSGDAAAGYLRAGAAGVQIGTLFACAEESVAHEKFKKALLRGQARDAQISPQLDPEFPVIPVRALKNKATESFLQAQREAIDAYTSGALSKEEAGLKIEHFWAGALRRAVIDGDTETGSLMAGQSVGMVKEILPVQEILKRLCDKAEAVLSA